MLKWDYVNSSNLSLFICLWYRFILDSVLITRWNSWNKIVDIIEKSKILRYKNSTIYKKNLIIINKIWYIIKVYQIYYLFNKYKTT